MALREVIPDPDSAMGDIPPINLIDGKMSGPTAAYLTSALRTIIAKFNGAISFGNGSSGYRAGNIDAQYIDIFTPAAANTEIEIPHGLGRKPIGYDVVRRDLACSVYDSSGGSWGKDVFFLKCSVGSVTLKIRVY
jgi:hypothetical protein